MAGAGRPAAGTDDPQTFAAFGKFFGEEALLPRVSDLLPLRIVAWRTKFLMRKPRNQEGSCAPPPSEHAVDVPGFMAS